MRLPTGDQIRGAVVAGMLLALTFGMAMAAPWLWIALVAVGAGWIVRQEYKIKNPSPTGDPEGAEDESPLFSVWEDRPGHCVVEWPEGADITDREDSNE